MFLTQPLRLRYAYLSAHRQSKPLHPRLFIKRVFLTFYRPARLYYIIHAKSKKVNVFQPFFAIFFTDVLCSVPLKSRHTFLRCAPHVNTFKSNNRIIAAAKYAFFSPPYLIKKITPCQIANPEVPISEPIEPHSVTKIYAATTTKNKKPSSKNHGFSHASPNQNPPNVEAMPLPPLNRFVTGKICPIITNSAAR